jgi:hypothetical protein
MSGGKQAKDIRQIAHFPEFLFPFLIGLMLLLFTSRTAYLFA